MCGVHADAGATFTCTRCGTFGCLDCLFSALAGREICRACAEPGLGEPIPWERRKELGLRRALWRTTVLACRQPARFYRTPATEAGVLWPMVYGMGVYTLAQLVLNVVMALLMLASGGVAALVAPEPALGAVLAGYGLCMVVAMVPLTLIWAPISAAIGIVIAAGAAHVMLALMKRTKGSFEDTLRAVSYSNAPYFWSVIPGCGAIIGWVWMLVIEVIAVRETHRTTTGRAAVATLLYRFVLLGTLAVGYAALVAGMIMLESRSR